MMLPSRSFLTLFASLMPCFGPQGAAAWIPLHGQVMRHRSTTRSLLLQSTVSNDEDTFDYYSAANHNHEEEASSSGWSVADDWEALSAENPLNAAMDSNDVFNQDIVQNAAQSMMLQSEEELSEEDVWLNEVIEDILQTPLSSTPLYDTGFSEKVMGTATHERRPSRTPEQEQKEFEDRMSEEIAMLVRCNESPEDMLVQAGRAMPELTLQQKTDVSQLLVWTEDGQWEPTPFYSQAVATIFHKHATKDDNSKDDNNDGAAALMMDAKAVSRWMTQSMGSDLESYNTRGRTKPRMGKDLVEDPTTMGRKKKTTARIGHHDSRVLKLITKYSTWGTGKLSLENLQQVYTEALTCLSNGTPVITESDNNDNSHPLQIVQLRNADHVRQVWRDLSNHGIEAPKVTEWKVQRAALEAQLGSSLLQEQQQQQQDFVDECEILDLAYEPPPTEQQVQSGHDEKNHKYIRKSSYENVPLAPDGKTPLYMNEGEFVFIDEESCIGCMQCVTAAPASFLMLESGRARTFHQRKGPDVKQGVAACPVNCMHYVSYDELKEFETVRDKGDGRDHHHRMGGHTPLHVSRRTSDNNRSSWYHHIKSKCCTSGRCPQRGCFDCPSYRASGENPYFKKKAKEAQHTRAQHFIDRGDVDLWRKTADL